MDEVLTVPLCVTWIETLPAPDALVALRRREDTMARRTFTHTAQVAYDALPRHAGAALADTRDGWTVVVEPNGFQGARSETMAVLSRETRALSVFWNANSDGHLVYAERGEVLALLDLFDPEDAEDAEDLPDALSAWRDLAEEDDPRVAGLVLGETLSGRRLDSAWTAIEHLSAVLDLLPAPSGEPVNGHGDSRVAAILAGPHPGRAREIAALVAETACELSGLDVPLAGRVLTALARRPDPATLEALRAETGLLNRELLAAAPTVDASPSVIDGWRMRYAAVGVLEAALGEDPVAAARDTIWRIGMLRLDDRAGRRVGTLANLLDEVSG
ncbi:DUF6461 domain-containing protein [Sinosporangium siamense]|uniref:DUF6461 domain-containing protein n=1 Tax=Sinosporangium siamense TaxID=1367973 RepID=UPI0019512481|nr:DUF6461 domain-containing protein [Sinosporangium siamense]